MKRLLLTLVLSAAVLASGTTRPALALPAAPAPAIDLHDALRLVVAAGAPGAIALVGDGRRTRSAAVRAPHPRPRPRLPTGDHRRTRPRTKPLAPGLALPPPPHAPLDRHDPA